MIDNRIPQIISDILNLGELNCIEDISNKELQLIEFLKSIREKNLSYIPVINYKRKNLTFITLYSHDKRGNEYKRNISIVNKNLIENRLSKIIPKDDLVYFKKYLSQFFPPEYLSIPYEIMNFDKKLHYFCSYICDSYNNPPILSPTSTKIDLVSSFIGLFTDENIPKETSELVILSNSNYRNIDLDGLSVYNKNIYIEKSIGEEPSLIFNCENGNLFKIRLRKYNDSSSKIVLEMGLLRKSIRNNIKG